MPDPVAPQCRQFQMMAAYNQWMNAQIYTACAKLDDEVRRQDRGAFFKSIHGTLNHLMFGDMIWFGRFINRPSGLTKHDVIIHEDFEALWAARIALDQELIDWSLQLTPDWLAAPFTWTTMAGAVWTMPAWILVSQLFNHGTHHRGQLTTLLSQLGIDSGPTDIPYGPYIPEFAV